MKFDITRQQLFTSLIVSIIIIVAYTIRLTHGEFTSLEQTTTHSLVSNYIMEFQSQHSFWSVVIAVGLTLWTTFGLGGVINRVNLYERSCLLPITLCGMWICTPAISVDYLINAISVFVFYRALRSLFKSVRAQDATDPLFTSALYLGILPILYPPAITLWAAMPIVIIMLGRTMREGVVTFLGMMIAPFTYLYVGWLCGDDFLAPINESCNLLMASSNYVIPNQLPLIKVVAAVLMIVSTCYGVLAFITNNFTHKSRSRLLVVFLSTIAIVSTLLLPSVSILTLVLLAPCVAIFSTLAMLNMKPYIANILYLILLVLIILNIFNIPLFTIDIIK